MTKKRLIAAALFTICPFAANAEFVDRGNGMIYDELLDITWLQDANYAKTSGFDADGLMTWDAANAWAASLTVGGVSGWRLPTMTTPGSPRPNENGQDTTGPTNDNELGWLWYQLGGGSYIWESTDISPFINLPFQDEEYLSTDEWYWSSEESGDSAWRMSMNCACWDAQAKQTEWHAWAVHDGDVAALPKTVAIDIKPGSCPNPLNSKSKGVLPVAILGTVDFDVNEIDPATVRLAGVAPLRWDFEDVATPYEPFTGKQDCTADCTEMGPDGYLDATLKFDTQEVIAALGEAVQDGACIVAELTGNLRESVGGKQIVGEDVIRINCKGK